MRKSNAEWVASILKHEKLVEIDVAAADRLNIEVKEIGEVAVAVISSRNVEASDIPTAASERDIDFVLNVPKDAVIQGSAIQLAASVPFGLGGVGDFYRAVTAGELRLYIEPGQFFIRRALLQHNAVDDVLMLNNKTYLVHRHHYEPYQFLALDDYDVSANAIRAGLDKYGRSRTVLAANPNAIITAEAVDAAQAAGVRIVTLRQLMGSLNS